MKWSQLTEINAGLMDSLTYEYVAEHMPVEYEARQKDKLRYRYGGNGNGIFPELCVSRSKVSVCMCFFFKCLRPQSAYPVPLMYRM